MRTTCPRCSGYGREDDEPCPVCNNTGEVEANEPKVLEHRSWTFDNITIHGELIGSKECPMFWRLRGQYAGRTKDMALSPAFSEMHTTEILDRTAFILFHRLMIVEKEDAAIFEALVERLHNLELRMKKLEEKEQ